MVENLLKSHPAAFTYFKIFIYLSIYLLYCDLFTFMAGMPKIRIKEILELSTIIILNFT